MKQTTSRTKTTDAALLLNRLQVELHLTTDRALAQRLELNAPLISKIRSGKSAVTASFLIRAHEITGHSIRELRSFMRDEVGYFSSYRAPMSPSAGVTARQGGRTAGARTVTAARK